MGSENYTPIDNNQRPEEEPDSATILRNQETLSKNQKGMYKDLTDLKKYQAVPLSTGGALLFSLCIMGISTIAAGASIRSCNNIEQQYVTPTIENVIGGPEPETFYERNGERRYVKIDGMGIDEYVRRD